MGVPKQSVNFAGGGGGGVSQAVLDGIRTDAESYTDSEIAAMAEIADGISTEVDLSVAGFVSINRGLRMFAAKPTGITNTTAETTLLTTTLTLPAKWTKDLNLAKWRLFGTFNNNTGGTRDLTISVKAPAGAVWSWTFSALAANAADRNWSIGIDCLVAEIVPNTIAILTGSGTMSMSDPGGGAVTSRLSPVTARTFTPGTDVAFDVTAQMSGTASTSLTTILVGGSNVDLAVPAS